MKRLEGGTQAAWLWDPERRRIVWANRAGLAFWGEPTLLDLLDRRFADEGAVRRIAQLGREVGAGEARSETFVFHPRQGERAVAATCTAQPLDDGRTGVLLVQITGAAALDADARDLRAGLFGAVVQALPVAVAVFDRHGTLVFQNAACREALDAEAFDAEAPGGETAGGVAGTGSVLAAWLGDGPRAAALIDRALRLGSVSEAETLLTRLGSRDHRVTARRIAAPIHGRTALLFAFEDIEDRRGLERQRGREQARLEADLAAAADVTFEIDRQGRLADLSGRVAKLFGVEAADLIGLDVDEAAERLALDLPKRVRRRLRKLKRVKGMLIAGLPRQDGADAEPAVFVLAARPAVDATGTAVALNGSLLRIAEARSWAVPAEPDAGAGTEPADAEDAAAEIAQPSAAEAADVETEERTWPPPSGMDDDVATFSEIGRAVAASARAAREEAEAAREEAEAAGTGAAPAEAAPAEAAQSERSEETARLRLVAGGRPVRVARGAAAVAKAAEPGPAAAPRVIDAAALDAAGAPALVHRGFEILYANDGLAGLLGFSDRRPLMADRNLLNLFPDERARLFSLQSRFDDGDVLQPGEVGMVPLRAKTADRRARTLLARLERVDFAGGPAVLMRFEAAQPSEARTGGEPAGGPPRPPAGDDELGRSIAREAELREIINSAADGIATLDGEGRILTLNPSAEAIFAVSAAAAEGQALGDLFTEEAGRIIAAYLQSLTETGVSGLHREGQELEGRRPDGSILPLYLTIGRMRVDHGPRFCAVIRDISHWKRAEADLRAAKEAAESASSKKSDFLAKISHELRTPLNAIIGFSEMMSAEKFGPIANDRYRGYLDDIHTSGQHLLGLINDLLDLSKVEQGKLELNFASVDMVRLVQQTVSLMQPQANREQVIIRTSLPDQLPPVVADERAMRQVMLNLLSNAIKFTPPGGQVILSALVDDAGRLQVRVRDTGVGMSPEELVRAMEPFRQIEQAANITSLPGTGLGLPLTKALVEANRAEFRVESTPNAGTLVQIIFPSERVLAG